ncbi:MAG: hypothetical protein IPG94_25340 [Kineosporiaceae bacterium]|nr:hypothetical protein [Kineosporiaceae bacterium]
MTRDQAPFYRPASSDRPAPAPQVILGTERLPPARHTAGQGSRRAPAWYQLRPSRASGTSTVDPVKRALALVEPLVVLTLGAGLGLVDQRAIGTSGWLRVPALVASLILVAQAILIIETRRHDAEEAASDEIVADSIDVVAHPLPVGRPGALTPVSVPSPDEPPAKRMREGPQVMYFVMGLAVWLGLATLANPRAPRLLLTLSLLASFLLFAEAYKQMRGRS